MYKGILCGMGFYVTKSANGQRICFEIPSMGNMYMHSIYSTSMNLWKLTSVCVYNKSNTETQDPEFHDKKRFLTQIHDVYLSHSLR